MELRVYSIAEACAIAGVRRTTLYKNIRTGKLRAIKIESRTFILAPDLYRWLDGMPPVVGDAHQNGEEALEPSVVISARAGKQDASNSTGNQ